MIVVFCPSRSRPDNAEEVIKSFEDTTRDVFTRLYFIVDEDDPKINDYEVAYTMVIPPQESGMCPALNYGLKEYMKYNDADIYGFIGDDHRFRTPGWDQSISSALLDPGIAYAFDGVRDDLPTNWFVSAEIVKALGWLALPECRHFYLDDAWKSLGMATGTLRYLPDVLIEHMHFSYGKSEMDDIYGRAIRSGFGDDVKYMAWMNSPRFQDAIRRVKEVI